MNISNQPNSTYMQTFYLQCRIFVFAIGLIFYTNHSLTQNQLPECTADVPFFVADLSSNPVLTYTTPEFVRKPGCCGEIDNYVSFYVTLHPDVAMFEIVVAPGYADPGGAGNYNIISGGDLLTPGACGVQIPGGAPICITGVGPHKIVYSKPGNNKVKYIFRQIPKPIYPDDQSTRIGCSLPLAIYGLNNITLTSINSSTGNTTPGAYNTLLSCTDCSNPSFSPGLATPTWIDYQICGTPQAAFCGTYATCDTVRLYTYSALNASAIPNPATFCSDGPGVLLSASASGGDGNYSYIWLNSSQDTVSMSNTYTATAAGTYTGQVADGLTTPTCPADYVSVPVIVADPPIVDAGFDQVVCASNPIITLSGTVTNATGVQWSGGAGFFNPSNTSLLTSYTPTSAEINVGFVTLTLTSTGAGGGCTEGTDQITITFSDTVYVNPIADPILCYGDNTLISANASGGTTPFTYSWSTGSTSSSITAPQGTYSVTVTDIYGCNGNSPITVVQPNQTILTMSSTNESIDGACDGSASVAISGGTGPFDILWSNLETTLTTSSTLCYGIYTVTVTDDNGCTVEGSVVVNNFTCSTFDVDATATDVDCYGEASGSAEAIIVSGGTGPFSYEWNSSPVQTTQIASNLSAGAYTVLVTDALGCYDIAGVTILQPTAITNTMTHTDVTTIGGSDGTATANPLGGTPGYTYTWTPSGQTTQTASNLSSSPGGETYYVEILDSKLCIKEDSVLINQPPCNNLSVAVNPTNVTCNGLSNGSAYIIIANGTAPYSIVWSNGPTDVMSVSGLTSGSYSVTVTDQANCSTFKSFDITQPDPISLALVPTNIICNGDANGSIDLTIAGGTYPFSYVWMLGTKVIATHEDLVDLEPGTYSITVTDANGCTAIGSVGITQASAINGSFTYIDNSCYGSSDGSVDATISGGVSPYSYVWTGPLSFTAISQDITGLTSGLYALNVTDLNGCKYGPIEAFINQPELLTASATLSNEVSCDNGADGSINLTVAGGTSPYSYAWTGPSGFTASTQNISNLIAGSYDVTVTDVQGCTEIESITVTTINDVTNPLITCQGNQSVNTSSSACTFTQSGTSWDASATDDCLVSTVEYVLSGATTGTGSTLNDVAFNIGTTTVTWTVTDGSGNTANCFYDVVVSDIQVPSILSCGGTGTQNVVSDFGVCTYTNSGTAWDATASDNCSVATISYSLSGATTGTGTSLDGQVFNLGTTLVTWTATDGSGNITTCTFNVSVTDNQLPSSVSCGGSGTETVFSNSGVCTYTNSGTAWDATASDNCTVSTITYSLSGATSGTGTSLNGQVFNLGTTLVTWTVSDGSGNISTCSFNVLVEDNQLPSILSCGAIGNQTVNANSGICTYTHPNNSWNASASDNCSVSTLTYSLSGVTSGTGTTLSGQTFNLGITTVTWTATDGSGNVTTCSFNVTVNDSQLPLIITCGANSNQTVNTDASQCNYTQTGTTWNAQASDNCSISSLIYTLSGATTGTGTSLQNIDFNIGTTTVTWIATDGSGNTANCSFQVLVSDIQVPSILSCGGTGTQNVVSDFGVCTYTNSGTAWDATASDNCSVATISYSLSGATTGTGTSLNGQVFNLGTTLVTWTATDGSGNSTTCTFNVTVTDNQLPSSVSCGGSGTETVSSNSGVCSYTNSGTAWDATASDNCTVSTITYSLSGATSGTGTSLNGQVFNLGTTLVTWTVSDGSGNISTCSFNVLVEDNQLPSILSCGAIGNQTVNANSGICTYTHPNNSWNASASDNCSITTLTYSLSGATSGTGSSLSGQTFNLGITTVTWTATDGSGNVTICSFNVTVNDSQLPLIITCGANTNQSVFSDASQCNYTQTGTSWNAIATDNCSISSLNYTLSGATTGIGTSLQNVDFNIGTTTVTWTATDGSGNTANCSFQVLVTDNQVPVISSCGASGTQNVIADAGVCTFTQTGTAWNATASDNCTVSTLTYTLSGATTGTGTSLNGVIFNPGTTTVTWTVTDNSSNTSTCSFTVIVADNQVPVISNCPSDITVGTDNGDCGATVNWTVPSFTDNCGATMTSSHTSGSFFAVGTTTITYTVTDGSGNVSLCSFTVTVNDDENPSIACPIDIATCNPSVTYSTPAATDNCGIQSVTQTSGLASGSNFPVGTTTNTFEVVDVHGNISSCSFDVIIHPTPVIDLQTTDVTCYGNGDGLIDIEVTIGTEPYTYDWSNSTITEDQLTLIPGEYFVTVTDDNGCIASASGVINQPDSLVISGLTDNVNCYNGNDGAINISVSGGNSTYSYAWSNSEITEDLNGLAAGTYSVIVTDDKGCVALYENSITQPDSLMIQSLIFDATCEAANGSIECQIYGGTIPYSYAWSNGSNNQNLIDAISGEYTLTVTDNQNCSVEYIGSINSVSNLEATSSVRDVICHGSETGQIQVFVGNGNGPYTYEWSNGDYTPSTDSLAAGVYSVIITDAFGCVVTLDFEVNEPDSLFIELSSFIYGSGFNVSTFNGEDGSIESEVFGGLSPYTYIWSNGEETEDLFNVSAGVYTLIVTDRNGCVKVASTTLTQPFILEMPSGFSPNMDGDNDQFVVRGIDAYPNNEIVIYNRWGNIVYQKENYSNEWEGSNMNGSALPDATYFVVLTVFTADEDIILKGYVDLRR